MLTVNWSVYTGHLTCGLVCLHRSCNQWIGLFTPGHIDCGLHCLQLVMLTVDYTVYTWSCWLWIALSTAGQAACGLDCLHLVMLNMHCLFAPGHDSCLWIDLFSEKVDREWMARHSSHSDAASLCSADAASSSPPTRGGCTRLVSPTQYQQHACNEQGEHLTYKFLPKVPIDRNVYQGRILLRIAHLFSQLLHHL